ncbi:MAG: phosphate acyltransferase PlsX [Spartobacteria bacterium]|nr:phosphate acyltransferase PlsX [Spartobacteria bacterium]
MRIAVDAMGGDYAPGEIVSGVMEALQAWPSISALYLVGQEEAIRESLKGRTLPDNLIIVNATEIVGMDEAPAAAIRRKKDSSISRAVELVKKGDADAVFSAGNTGAAVAATTVKLRTLEGVIRPAIATIIPTQYKPFILIDAGATIDCPADLLFQFGVMGSVYSKEILGVPAPRVGLLSIGEEQAKGNEATKKAFQLLENSSLNFIGNVESRDIFAGKTDVVVCDGFVGNIVLKTSESVARVLGRWIKEELTSNPLRMLGAMLCRGGLRTIKERGDPAVYGGAPLLGINGACIIGHGSSSALAVRNAIRVSLEWIKHDINHIIIDELALSKGKKHDGC